MEAEKVKKSKDLNLTRISSALIGFPLVVLICIIGNKLVISISLAIIAILSMHEYLDAVSKKANPVKWISYLSCALISGIAFLPQEQYGNAIAAAIPILLLTLFAQVIVSGMKTNFNDLVYTLVGIIYIAFFVFGVIITMWGFYIFPYIARFENTTKNVLKNTVFIAISNIHWTIIMTVLFIAMWVGIYLFMPVAIVMPVLYQLLKNIAIEHVFKKYMTPEDLELEAERNRNFYN